MKNTRFARNDTGIMGLATSTLTLTGYAPTRQWILVPMMRLPDGGIVLDYDRRTATRPLHYAGSRAQVAECLIAAGFTRIE